MLWWSNHQSIQEERISALAILETLLAVSLAIGIYLYSGSLVHIATSAALAPFLLLRTPGSTKQGLLIGTAAMDWVWEAIEPRLMRLETPSKRFYIEIPIAVFVLSSWILLVALEIFVSIAVKIGITTFNLLTHPLASFGAIPINWRRIVLCTDSVTPPEIYQVLPKLKVPKSL